MSKRNNKPTPVPQARQEIEYPTGALPPDAARVEEGECLACKAHVHKITHQGKVLIADHYSRTGTVIVAIPHQCRRN